MRHERLDPRQMERYQAHLALPDFGPRAQLRLLNSSALIVGAGGLGSPIALYLAAAGVGRLVVADDDVVDTTNLQRQVIYSSGDVGRPKAEAAAERMRALNPEIEVVASTSRVTATSAREMVAGHDVVLDGSDNFATRYVVNDACVIEGVPLVSGSLYRYEGQVLVVRPGRSACYRCVFRAAPPEQAPCHDAGVLGALAGMIGTIQAAEALKLLARGDTSLEGSLLLVDAEPMQMRAVKVERDRGCPVCGDAPVITEPTAVAVCESRER